MLFLILVTTLLIVGWAFGRRGDKSPMSPVAGLEIERYMGTWYEIARFDHFFERRLVDVKAEYRLLANGRIAVENSGVDYRSGRHKRARGKAYATQTPGHLRVSFFWFFYADYKVLELDEHYRWALVGGKSSRYLWILARTPSLDVPVLNHILQLADRRGYRTERLLFVDQSES